MIKKGIILAGGTGSRLSPITKATNKQLLPVYDKPLIFYPISSLMLAGIKNILIIVNKGSTANFKKLLGDGKHLGLKILYKEQEKPTGIPEAFIIGEKFIGKDKVALILGDNFFYGQGLGGLFQKAQKLKKGCKIFLKDVTKPENYGVAKILKNKIVNIEEKPKNFLSNKAITGLYFFDNNVIKIAKKLKPSSRGETEIVDIIVHYFKNNLLEFSEIGRGAIWSDVGKIEELHNISNYIASTEKVQGVKISCLEEIALQKKWVSKKQVKKNISFYKNSPYSDYLKKLIK